MAVHVQYGTWLYRVVAWDGLLPVFTMLVPVVLDYMFPVNPKLRDIAITVVPIVTFFARLSVGVRHVSSNQVGKAVRTVQYLAFILGILVLFTLDGLLLVMSAFRDGQMVKGDELPVVGVWFGIYLVFMVVAMFPGWVEVAIEVVPDGTDG